MKNLVTKLSKIATGKNSIEICNYLKFEAGRLCASNLETQISYKFLDFSGSGLIRIDQIKKIASIKGRLFIEFSANGSEAYISVNDKKKFTFSKLPDINDFPAFDFTEKSYITDLPGSELLKFSYFICKDELRPAMCGIYFDKNDLVATDAHKLRFSKFKRYDIKKETFILPSGVLPLINKDLTYKIDLCGKLQEYGVYYRNCMLYNVNTEEIIITRLTDNKYPNWQSVVPENNNLILAGKTADLTGTIQQALIAANKTTKQIALNLNRSLSSIYAADQDENIEFTDNIKANFNGSLNIGFNGDFLINSLKLSGSENYQISFSGPSRAAILNNEILLMPVMLAENS